MGTAYLDLTNRVLRRLNEVEIESSNFSSVRGVQAAAKDAVLDCVRKINSQKFEWPFNAATGTQLLVVGQEQYSWPADLRAPDWESFYIQKDDNLNVNTKRLKQISRTEWFESLRDHDFDSESEGRHLPDFVFETDSGGFGVTPSPNEAYTVKYRYWIRTVNLVNYGDLCTIPSDYDHVITEGALADMFMFMDNDERANVAKFNYQQYLAWMTYTLIPKDPYLRDTRVPNAG